MHLSFLIKKKKKMKNTGESLKLMAMIAICLVVYLANAKT
jgi:hypothetical protein